jgi:hypothetical protein
MAGDTQDGKNVRAVERAIDILQCFLPDEPWMSVIEIQQRVPLSRPTLYRLLQTLRAKGLIRVQGEPQRFALDFGVGRLARSWIAGIDAIALARPILERLRRSTGETTALFVRRGELRQCVAELVSPHVLAISRGLGETDHLWRGASGKSILAFMKDEKLRPFSGRCPRLWIGLRSSPIFPSRAKMDSSSAAARFLSALSRSLPPISIIPIAWPDRSASLDLRRGSTGIGL